VREENSRPSGVLKTWGFGGMLVRRAHEWATIVEKISHWGDAATAYFGRCVALRFYKNFIKHDLVLIKHRNIGFTTPE
jgi:hypothetical protein